MLETPNNEKQQYLEGPWNRVSGNTPFTQGDLSGLRENLDQMYGEANWQASPNAENPGKYDIVVSPDNNSVYATMARNVDRKGGLGNLPPDNPTVKEILGRVALQEAQPQQATSAEAEVIKR